MKLEFVSNTGCYLEHEGTVFGMDLWLTQGAFEGSWFHYPPLRSTQFKVSDCKYIYISHIHPDHCDFNALKQAGSDTHFVVPDYFNRLIERKLRSIGFNHVSSVSPDGVLQLEENLSIRLFPQFKNNLFHEAAFGNLIDSALCIEWDGRTILNCGDNYLNEGWGRRLRREYPRLDLLLAPHSASGPYPASFRNLSTEMKREEAIRLQTQYISHWCDSVQLVGPRIAVPCAAEYVVVGCLHEKNANIGLASPKMAVSALLERQGGSFPVCPVQLDCGTILNIDSGIIEGQEVRVLDEAERMAFAFERRDIPFDYQWEDSFADADFDALFRAARESLWKKQNRLGWKSDYNVYFYIDEQPCYGLNFSHDRAEFFNGNIPSRQEPFLECYLSRQLFFQILVRRAHWNNAEGGLHIDFFRQPNTYVPEVFTLLSFLEASSIS